ncbi:MAG TPA: DUF4307 domain-containing protein [Friedmanniella sp.]
MTEPATVDAAAAVERLARRYPPPLVSRRGKIAITTVATLVALSWLVWTALLHATPTVSGDIAGFQVVSDTAIEVTMTVQRGDPSRPATCDLLAQSTDFQPVAQSTVQVAPSSSQVVNVTQTLTTLRRATSVTVRSCSTG